MGASGLRGIGETGKRGNGETECGARCGGTSPTPGPRSPAPGFTLLEVVLAIMLLGIVLSVAMELLSVGLRSARSAGDYTGAVLLANRKLAEMSLARPAEGSTSGTAEGGYTWRAEIAPQPSEEDLPGRLYTLRVAVAWPGRGGEKRLELTTLRLAMEDQQIVPTPSGSAQPGAPRGAATGGARGRTPAPRASGSAR